jgi:hypothetical protein
VTVEAEIAFDRPRLLALTRGLIMIDLSVAVLATLIWYLAKYHLQPQIESRAIAEYSYRAGCRDTTMKLLRATELHLVRTTPPPATPPQRQPHEYVAKSNGRQRAGAPS